MEIQPAAPFQSLSDEYDEKKSDLVTVEPVVTEVDDIERNGKKHSHYIYENVPEGIDPRLIREERVVRGLSERHIQVGCLAHSACLVTKPPDDRLGGCDRYGFVLGIW